MDNFKGIYYVQGGQPFNAAFDFRRKKVHIQFRDETGMDRELYWYYDKIIREDFRKGDGFVVKYLGFPVQVLELKGEAERSALENRLYQHDSSRYRKVFGSNGSLLLKVLGGILLLAGLVYFLLIPFLAERLALKVPVSYEQQMGDGMFNALQPAFDIDEEKTLLINDFFQEMHIPSEYDVHITVVKEETANAFAFPGGHIVVFDKIIKDMDHYEELAALLAHEFIHVNERHATRSIFRQLGSSMFLSVLFGNGSSLVNLAIQQANNLKGLDYSRKLEKEADLQGLKIICDRKMDGNGFVELFRLLQKEVNTAGEPASAEWISSHPDLQKRIGYIKRDPHFNANGVEEHPILASLFKRLQSGW
ncbi:MAG: M48 family metalloprotease [Terrimonas sp.]|nr:M48 family metalloprotease [Terrimonas sp.]